MASKGRANAGVVEYHSRFCRGCGHDLVGLTGRGCPQCDRDYPALVVRSRTGRTGRTGRWLVVAVVCAGTVLAMVGMRFRNLSARRPTPATGPTTLSSPTPGR